MQPISALCIAGFAISTALIGWITSVPLDAFEYQACCFAGGMIVGVWCAHCDAKESGLI